MTHITSNVKEYAKVLQIDKVSEKEVDKSVCQRLKFRRRSRLVNKFTKRNRSIKLKSVSVSRREQVPDTRGTNKMSPRQSEQEPNSKQESNC